MTSLVVCRGVKILNTNRPFDGDGVKMYVGTSPESIRYRPNQIVSQNYAPLIYPTTNDVSVATKSSPNATDEISYTLPAALIDTEVWYQLRTYKDDYENQSIYRPRRLVTDGDGEEDNQIHGTALVTQLQKRDGGGLRIKFLYTAARDGLQPTQFVIVKTSGSGTIASVVVTATNAREYTADVAGLTNGVAYQFRLDAENGDVTATLLTGIAFTGDAAGPAAVTSLVAVEA